MSTSGTAPGSVGEQYAPQPRMTIKHEEQQPEPSSEPLRELTLGRSSPSTNKPSAVSRSYLGPRQLSPASRSSRLAVGQGRGCRWAAERVLRASRGIRLPRRRPARGPGDGHLGRTTDRLLLLDDSLGRLGASRLSLIYDCGRLFRDARRGPRLCASNAGESPGSPKVLERYFLSSPRRNLHCGPHSNVSACR